MPLLQHDISSLVLFLGQVMVAFFFYSLSLRRIEDSCHSKQDPLLKCVMLRKDKGAVPFQDETLPRRDILLLWER